MLGAVAVVLAAAASIVDKRESLRWLWVGLVVAGALVAAPAAILASPWWQHRQDARAAQQATIARRARMQEQADRGHWDPRGRGVLPFSGRRGWYFIGRTRALRELAGWLAAAPGSQPAVRLVTGDPGSGKSAVLGRLVTLADPARRGAALAADPRLDPAAMPLEGVIDVSVHARGQTSAQVVEAIAAAADVQAGTAEELLAALEGREPLLMVVVDALDEATGAEEVAGLLARLAATGGVRLLVGTRRHLVDWLVAPNAALDLDDPDYLEPGDVAEYVRRCLLLEGDPDAPTPYRGRAELAATVAAAVAKRAEGSFLVAQLVSLALVNAGQAVDVDQPGWHDRFPREVGQAMRDYLNRLGTDRATVRDLLVPLAFAQGEGLANEALWAALASELGTRPYRPQDIGWLLQDSSAPNLLQRTDFERDSDGNRGGVAWRLFHEALAEYLREHETRYPPRAAHSRYVQVLLARVRGEDGQADWLAADAYTRSHLATHAAAAGYLDELITDPGLLLAAEPARLLGVLPNVSSPEARAAARAYQQAAPELMSNRPLGQRASCLHRAARYGGATDLAERILQLGIRLPWTTRWAHWQATGISRPLTGHSGEVTSVAVGQIDGRPVIVSSSDETVRVWDARTGQPRGGPLTGHKGTVFGVAVGQIDGQPVIVSGSGDDRVVRVWDARTGQPRGDPLTGHSDRVYDVAVGEIDNDLVIVSGSGDKTIRMWDARTGQPRGDPLIGHSGYVDSVAVGEIDNDLVIVSGSGDKTIRMWDARTGQPRGDPLIGHSEAVTSVAVGQIDDQPVIVSGGFDKTVRVWDARTGQPRGDPLTGHSGYVASVAVGEIDGRPVIVSGSGNDDRGVRVWDARTGQPRGGPLIGHSGSVASVAVGQIDDQPVIVSGGASDGTVRIWDASITQPETKPTGHSGSIESVAVGQIDDQPVIVSGGGDDGTVWLWDARTGQPRGGPLTGHKGTVFGVAVGQIDGQPVIVSSADKTVRVWDARTGQPRGDPLTGHRQFVTSVAVGEIDGQPVIVSGSGDKTIRMWDARTGQPRRDFLTGHSEYVSSVAVGQINDQLVIVSGGYEGTVRVWDARTGQPRGDPLIGHREAVTSVAVGQIDDQLLIVSGGWDKTVRLWDARAGQPRGGPLTGHSDVVSSVAVGHINEQPVVVSGSYEGTVRVWDAHTRKPLCIIETDARSHGVVCANTELVVAATVLGLAAFQLPAFEASAPSK